MSNSTSSSHILIIPFPSPGHILPLMDLSHQLAISGSFTITVVVTPKNLLYLNPLLSHHPSINSLVFPFPSHPSVPAGVEHLQSLSCMPDLVAALALLYDPILHWCQNNPSLPSAIISDMLLSPWTHRLALHLDVKHIMYNVVSTHALCDWLHLLKESQDIGREIYVAMRDCWGVINNCFADYSPKYFELLKTEILSRQKVWEVGPLLPLNESSKYKAESSNKVIEWLDSYPIDNSVVYIAFGSQITLSKQQMEAIADALVESEVNFIWVVKETLHDSVLEELEKQVGEKGVVIRGWAPQVAILEHRAVGMFLSHFGWNTLLEGLLAGLLMLAWPMQADHFSNANLVVHEMGAAIQVCEGLDAVPENKRLAQIFKDSVSSDRPERTKAMDLRRKALNAIKEGGSSYKALDELVTEISNFKISDRTKLQVKHQS